MGWSELTPAKKAIAIIGVCCIGIIIVGAIIGIVLPDKTFSFNTNKDKATESTAPIQIKIITNGGWSGALGSTDSITSHEGTGDKTFDFNETGSGIVSASIQKQSGDSSELKVQIIKNGAVAKESSTTAAYGVVTIAS